MLALKIIAVILGRSFTLFGYFIRFRQKYFLINGFDQDFKAGRKDARYAKRVGIAEFMVGIALLAASALLIAFA